MKPISALTSVWFGILMVLAVLTLFVAVLFTDFMSDRLFGGKRMFFLCLMLFYALYRSIRIYQQLKKKDEH